MTWLQWAEALSYIVTVFGLPLAILVFIYEQRRERRNEQEEIYQRLFRRIHWLSEARAGQP